LLGICEEDLDEFYCYALWVNIFTSTMIVCVSCSLGEYIYIHNDCLCFSNKLNCCYYHRFPMKHFLHFSKLWTICHFMSIQTIDVTCIRKCFLCFLTWLCRLYSCHCGLLFLLFTCLHIVICHPTICSMFVPVLLCVSASTAYLIVYGSNNALFASAVVILSSHNIAASLCCCNVECFILVVKILKHDYKLALNTIVKKLSLVSICKP